MIGFAITLAYPSEEEGVFYNLTLPAFAGRRERGGGFSTLWVNPGGKNLSAAFPRRDTVLSNFSEDKRRGRPYIRAFSVSHKIKREKNCRESDIFFAK